MSVFAGAPSSTTSLSVAPGPRSQASLRDALRPAPLLAPACALMLGIVASEYGGIAALVLGLAGVIAIDRLAKVLRLHVSVDRITAAIQLGVGLLAFGAGYARHRDATALALNDIAHAVSRVSRPVRIEGTVASPPIRSPAERRNPFMREPPRPRVRFVLEAERSHASVPAAAISGYVAVNVQAEKLDLELGDRVTITGWLHALRGPRNPGETDWARWHWLQGIHAGLAVEDSALVVKTQAAASPLLNRLQRLRATARAMLFESYEAAGDDPGERLLDALVLGQRSAVDRKVNDAFRRTGAIHFLSVSGFHIGALLAAIWFVFRKLLRRGPRTTALLATAVLVIYTAIAEPNSPILRSSIMGMLFCISIIVGRPFAGLNWLALSAVLILLVSPLELFQAGFQFSFLQVFALLTVVGPMYLWVTGQRAESTPDADSYWRLLRRWLFRVVMGTFVTCACCWLVALPLSMHYFGQFTPWAALQSMLISPLVALVTILGLVKVALGLLLPDALLAMLLQVSTNALLGTVDWMARWPLTLLETPLPPTWLVAVSEVAIFALLWPRRRAQADSTERGTDDAAFVLARAGVPARLWRALVPAVALATLIGVWWPWLRSRVELHGEYRIHVLSVGNGSAALVQSPDGDGALLDVGTPQNFDAGMTAVQASRALGVRRLAFVSISHGDLDHYSGLPTVIERMPPGRLIGHPEMRGSLERTGPGKMLLDRMSRIGPVWIAASVGDSLALERATFEVLWPPADLPAGRAENDRSLVLRMNVYGLRVLVPGDAARDALRGMLELHAARRIDLRSDVLIAPHHGAVLPHDTEAFLRAVEPECIVQSDGRDRPELLRLARAIFDDRCRVLSTHEVGAVTVRVAPDSRLTIETPYDGSNPTLTRY